MAVCLAICSFCFFCACRLCRIGWFFLTVASLKEFPENPALTPASQKRLASPRVQKIFALFEFILSSRFVFASFPDSTLRCSNQIFPMRIFTFTKMSQPFEKTIVFFQPRLPKGSFSLGRTKNNNCNHDKRKNEKQKMQSFQW